MPNARYDSHRSAILRSGETHQAGGGSGAAAGGRPEDDVDPFQFFTPSCFSGYSDGSRGFYTVYSSVFSKVAAEEAQAREAEGSLRDDTAPTFGEPGLAAPLLCCHCVESGPMQRSSSAARCRGKCCHAGCHGGFGHAWGTPLLMLIVASASRQLFRRDLLLGRCCGLFPVSFT